MVRCNACNGTYEPIGADGLQYFHKCPPLTREDVAAAIGAGTVPYPNGATAAAYAAKALASGDPTATGPRLAADDWLKTTTFHRANARDENVPTTAEKDAGTMKAKGAGTTPIAAPPPRTMSVP